MGGGTYIYPIHNIRLNWYLTFTDVYMSKVNPNEIKEHRIFRMFPRPNNEHYCIDYQDDTEQAGNNIIFMVKNYEEALQKAFDIFSERFDKKD